MKFSKFNSIIDLEGKDSILFNAATKMYIVFNSSLKSRLIDGQIDFLQANYPNLYAKLIEAKCLIEDDTDELANLKDIADSVNNNPEECMIFINPTLDCNFRCWYCYENHRKGSQMDEEMIERVKKFIKRKINDKETKNIHLSFFGGEPLLKFTEVIEPLLKYSKKECANAGKQLQVGMTSNGYLLSEEIINVLGNYQIAGIQITLDGCREDHNKVRRAGNGKDSFQIILNNAKALLKNQIPVSLRINYTSVNIGKIAEIKEDLIDLSDEMKSILFINLQQVWQDKDEHPDLDLAADTDKIIYGFREMGLRAYFYTADKITSSCYADKKNQVLINYNGDVFKCTARDFTPENRYGYLDESGNIKWDEERLIERINARFKNPSCLKCRIAPLCSGGCSQVLIENQHKDYCLYGHDEKKKDKIILDYFENTFIL